jgi:tRNA-Thr(GGU) m(6)t(6)A37 methyltransferase TsaA
MLPTVPEFLLLSGVVRMPSDFSFQPIGQFFCDKKQTLEASSQGVLDPESQGLIELADFPQLSAMLADLDGFSHLWVIFVFHRHWGHWKPKVLPPRANKKVGVFASRSPYRPSPIGLSAVKLERIEGRKIYIRGHDLIDQTPILDIKPYLPYADSFPEAALGWLADTFEYSVLFSDHALKQLSFLNTLGLGEFKSTIIQQLRFHPTDHRRKRVRNRCARGTAEKSSEYIYSYRTWRVHFSLTNKTVFVAEIVSGYSPAEMENDSDPYHDKEFHRAFFSFLPDSSS